MIKKKSRRYKLILFFVFILVQQNAAYADRVKDIADVAGVRSNHLVGYGLVVGLAGTGDGKISLSQVKV